MIIVGGGLAGLAAAYDFIGEIALCRKNYKAQNNGLKLGRHQVSWEYSGWYIAGYLETGRDISRRISVRMKMHRQRGPGQGRLQLIAQSNLEKRRCDELVAGHVCQQRNPNVPV